MANMNFGVNILPKANNTYTLGNSDYKWNIFANSLNGVSLSNIITDVQINGTSILSNNIANIPIVGYLTLGLVQVNSDYGISANGEGRLYIIKANSTRIKEGTNQYFVITPYNQHESVFYGLAKAAGDSTQSASSNAVGTYTDSAKTAIQNMLAVAPTANPIFTGTISLGRDANSIVGLNSVALGYANRAQGNSSIAMGAYNYANTDASIALGYNNMAMGAMSFAGGFGTRAHGAFSYTFGLNTADDIPSYTNWTASTSYAVGDNVVNPEDNLMYTCIEANSDATFNYSKWIPIVKSTFIEKIGNGELNITTGTLGTKSNARALDWQGNEYLNGYLYVGCNANSSNGIRVPHDIQINGTSIVSNGVANIPLAARDTLGAVMINGYGLWISSENGLLATNRATLEHIKPGTQEYRPIVPCNQHEAVFYGLAKAAGDSTQSASSNAVGLYTDSAKTAIKNMLAVPKIDDNEDYDLNTTWSAKRLSSSTRIYSWIGSNFSGGIELPTPTIIANQKIDEQGNLVSDSNYNTYVYTLTLNTMLIVYTQNNEEFIEGQYSSSSISSSNLYGDITITNGYDYIQIMAPYFAFSCEKTTVNNHNVIILYMGFTGVTNTDYATTTTPGIVMVNGYGLWVNPSNGHISLTKASTNQIKEGTQEYYPIVPYNLKDAVFYGLAKAAGDSTQAASSNTVGTYTDGAKTAIQNMLNVSSKTNPIFTGSISLGRKANSTIGTNSIAIGTDTIASGANSSAFGNNSWATAAGAYAIGNGTKANGEYSYAMGYASIADGDYSIVTGGQNIAYDIGGQAHGIHSIAFSPYAYANGFHNLADGTFSYAIGMDTSAVGIGSFAAGISNVYDEVGEDWEASKSYSVGDIVYYEESEDKWITYRCITANSDATFDSSKWSKDYYGHYIESIGNGQFNLETQTNTSVSNARALDWNGNEYLNGDLYVRCNADSTGGTKVATISEIPTITSDLTNDSSFVSAGFADGGLVLTTGTLFAEEVSF